MKRTISLALFLLGLLPSVFSDSVYQLDLTTDLILGGGSLGLFAASQLVTPQDAGQADIESINPLDSLAMFGYDENLDAAGSYAAYASLVLPVITVLYEIEFPGKFLTYAAMYSEAFLLAYGTKDLLKGVVSRYRPYSYLGSIPAGEEEDVYNSFPSGHTGFAFLSAAFLTTTFFREYPASPWRYPVSIGSYSLAAFIAASRVLSGNHYITDVLCGAAIGSFWGWLVPELHRRKDNSAVEIACFPVYNGVLLSFRM